MRISDWSSDVCSSDLGQLGGDRADLDPVPIQVQGKSIRPICHFEVADAKDYLSRRPPNMKNEYGEMNAIENHGVKCVEVESRGIRSEERRVGKECVITCRSRGSR